MAFGYKTVSLWRDNLSRLQRKKDLGLDFLDDRQFPGLPSGSLS
jgi:hypothetical protein